VNIAIDFDDTLTADSKLWEAFIKSATELGHTVYCVTARRDTDENRESISEWMRMHGIMLHVIYTALASKVWHMQKLGIRIDIWIDDDPKRCALGH
jgi:hypothetical protein